ncbi:MAG: hypothetical protein HY226_00315 [Candidatus Vogelbacteria bacterium]|nr:hypothetical protein [Candidatus Vogelbacteria bacterium]
MFFENRLIGNSTAAYEYVNQVERETIKKIYKTGIPGTPNGKTINAIISKVKKSQVDIQTMMAIEQLAYRGFFD